MSLKVAKSDPWSVGLNTTTEYPPVFCPPTEACHAIRSKPVDNICPTPQGRYEPIVCFPGHYCPPGGREQIRCEQGYYCPQGTYQPIKCKALSICLEGSERELSLVGIVSLAVIYLLWLLSFKFSKRWETIQAWVTLERYTRRKRTRRPDTEMVQLASSTTDVSKSGQRAVAENPMGVNSPTIFESLIKDRNIHELGLEFSLREIQCNLGDKLHPILQGISGNIMKGRLFGILGPSGAGKCKFTIPDTAALCAKAKKATLINVLAGRSKPTYGSISINGVSGDRTKSVQC